MCSRTVRLALGVGTSVVLGVLLAAPASALSSSSDLTDRDQIVMNGRLLVSEGDTV
jgi:hypothetical protein